MEKEKNHVVTVNYEGITYSIQYVTGHCYLSINGVDFNKISDNLLSFFDDRLRQSIIQAMAYLFDRNKAEYISWDYQRHYVLE